MADIAPAMQQSSEPHWVQCNGFRCLALLGRDGKWKCVATGKDVAGIVKIYPK